MQKREKQGRPFEKKVTDPSTGKRVSFYSAISVEDAHRKGLIEFGLVAEGDTLRDFYFGTYVPSIANLSEGSIHNIAWAMENHVLPVFGRRALSSITRKDLQSYFNRLGQTKKISTTSVALVKKVMSGVFTLAEADELVTKSPVRGVRLAPATTKDIEPLTFQESKDLIDKTEGYLRNAVILMLCGLRAGECSAVMWSDITNGVLSVQRQKVKVVKPGKFTKKGHPVKEWKAIERLKTPQSVRQVPIPDLFIEMLTKGSVMVCGDTEPATLWRELSFFGIHPHRLRHTFVSLMENELEAPRRVVAQLAGKSKASEMDRYSKSAASSRQRWMDAYAKAVVLDTTVGGLELAGS